MVLGFLGKGGSGKSSLAWLAGSVSAQQNKHVLSVDADHNMDLSYAYKLPVAASTVTMHRTVDQFREYIGLPKDARWSEFLFSDAQLPTFHLSPPDAYTSLVTRPIGPNHQLVTVGLGAEDILESAKCAHAHIAPLKFYLPLLERKPEQVVVVDGVAGVDMMNYGLFVGADLIVGVVEPHQNSIRVYQEVKRIAAISGIPCEYIVNKYSDTVQIDFEALFGTVPLAVFSLDDGIRSYDLARVSQSTIRTMENLLNTVEQYRGDNIFDRLRTFEKRRQ